MVKKFICLIFIISILGAEVFAFYDEIAEENLNFEIIETMANSKYLILNSKNAILYDNTYNQILYEKNAYDRVPNASTTKVLTAIVAYEKGNLSDIVTVSKNAALIGGSGINLRTNDKVSLEDLIKGLMVHSGNDAAVAIAEHVGGSIENFCNMMNEKAKDIGLENTNFVTPHGLDRENHYSTAYDLVKMSEYLLNIEFLANIVKERSVTIKVNDVARTIGTTNEMLSFYEGADGVKTGFTGDAGRCLISSATKDGRKLISVVLGCGTKKQRTVDSVKLLDYGFNNYELVDVLENMKKEFKITVEKGKATSYKVVLDGKMLMPIEKNKSDKITYKYEINTKLSAPIEKGENIGKIYILYEDKILKVIDINLTKTIEKKDFLDYFNKFIKIDMKNYEIKL